MEWYLGGEMMDKVELTKEELDQKIKDAVKEATKGLYTEKDLESKVTAEVDRRVETGIQKGLETKLQKEKQKWEEENTLSAEELAQKKYEEKFSELSTKEKEIARQRNELDAKGMLANAEIPKEKYEKMLGVLISDDGEETTSRVQNFIDLYSETKQELETKFKSEFSNVPSPQQGGEEGKMTKEKFDKLGYSEKLKVKTESPEVYKSIMGGEEQQK